MRWASNLPFLPSSQLRWSTRRQTTVKDDVFLPVNCDEAVNGKVEFQGRGGGKGYYVNLIGSDVVDDAGEAGVASNHHRCIVDRLEENGRLFSRAGPWDKRTDGGKKRKRLNIRRRQKKNNNNNNIYKDWSGGKMRDFWLYFCSPAAAVAVQMGIRSRRCTSRGESRSKKEQRRLDDVDDSQLNDCQLGCRLDLDDPQSLESRRN